MKRALYHVSVPSFACLVSDVFKVHILENDSSPPLSLMCQEDGSGLFHQRHAPASEDVTSDEERMVICEEEGDDDVMGELDATF